MVPLLKIIFTKHAVNDYHQEERSPAISRHTQAHDACCMGLGMSLYGFESTQNKFYPGMLITDVCRRLLDVYEVSSSHMLLRAYIIARTYIQCLVNILGYRAFGVSDRSWLLNEYSPVNAIL